MGKDEHGFRGLIAQKTIAQGYALGKQSTKYSSPGLPRRSKAKTEGAAEKQPQNTPNTRNKSAAKMMQGAQMGDAIS
jgi:hypothetical protein